MTRHKSADQEWGFEGESRTRAFVLHIEIRRRRAKPVSPGMASGAAPSQDTGARDRCAEALGLAEALDLDVAGYEILTLSSIRPAALLGAGRISELKSRFAALDVELVIVNHDLTPVQQRNLEKSWNTKVLDRTGLILEIFSNRARTREGRLQVELAHLSYQKSRLVRSWTHVERQRGGLGFVGGPGETQIESDRRMIQERITRLQKELDHVKRTRALHRQSRQKVPYPVVALVGYTNAGKSTLFNRLTGAKVLVRDMLFATLDPTMREVELPGGGRVILSDTVGFISQLPTQLIAAFRATLEEVLEADLILHVRDIASPSSGDEAREVARVLAELEAGPDEIPSIEIWNKIDLLDDDRRRHLIEQAAGRPDTVAVSAVTGQGVDALLDAVRARLNADSIERTVTIGSDAGATLNWLYENAEILRREELDDGQRLRLEIRIKPGKVGQMEQRIQT